MTTVRRKPQVADRSVLRASSRLRSRVLALLEGAFESSGLTQVDVANRLGIKKAAVNNTLNGSGNLTIETLALYLGAMGYEADVVAVAEGEILASMREARRPKIECLTLHDRDWINPSDVITVANPPGRNQGTRVIDPPRPFSAVSWGG